uniref:G_PROTEIN_RECEP_F1_2 domain-containing protein n=1 Tax=Macrostomum lignano TaxID=282301 RepID=A0A1I8I1E2_9PLAT
RHLEARRQRRANWQLTAISLTFSLSWLPLSVVNIVQECKLIGKLANNGAPHVSETAADNNVSTFGVVAAQTVPLVLVLVSACLNPVFYGWLNENFQTELKSAAGRVIRRDTAASAANDLSGQESVPLRRLLSRDGCRQLGSASVTAMMTEHREPNESPNALSVESELFV